jgi:protein-L-isoaspartate(D-aspartate) O-methyltransferase
VIPVGDRDEQVLAVFTKRGPQIDRRDVGPVRFVPLLGAYGWTS